MNGTSIQLRPWERIHGELGVQPPEPETTPLGALVAQAAMRIPQHSALYFEGQRLSFAWLDSEANKLANALVAHGVGKGDVIGIYMPSSPQFAVALVAASKMGAVVTGISSLLAPREVEFQLRDSEARVLLTVDSFAADRLTVIETLPETLAIVVVTSMSDYINPVPVRLPALRGPDVRGYLDLLDGRSEAFEQVPVGAHDCFLLQYTGGTTGMPKGAMLPLVAVMTNPVAGNIYLPYVYGEERMASAFPLFHIGGIMGFVGALAAGGEYLIVVNPRDIEKFIDQIIDMRPTRLGAVPTFYQLLVSHPRLAEIDFDALKFAVTGGAPITKADRAVLDRVLGRGKLADVFGMTETCSTYVMNPPMRAKPASLGIPVPGADVRIVDTQTGTRLVPVGEPGEIITAGLHVMTGYRNRPDETAHALRVVEGRTWMHTGDVGYFDEEGYLYISDRVKDMLVVGGFKVFSLEVESKLRELDFIAASALVGTADLDRPGNDIVNLFVKVTRNLEETEDESFLRDRILRFCKENLAPYKRPKRIMFIEDIPLTAVGKIDKKALRDIAAAM